MFDSKNEYLDKGTSAQNSPPKHNFGLRHIFLEYIDIPKSKTKILIVQKFKLLKNYNSPTNSIIVQRFTPIYQNSNLYLFINILRVKKVDEYSPDLPKPVPKGGSEDQLSMRKETFLKLFDPQDISYVKSWDVYSCKMADFKPRLIQCLIDGGEPLLNDIITEKPGTIIGEPIRDINNYKIAKIIISQKLTDLEKIFPENFHIFYGLTFYIIYTYASEEDFCNKTSILTNLTSEEKTMLYSKAFKSVTNSPPISQFK